MIIPFRLILKVLAIDINVARSRYLATKAALLDNAAGFHGPNGAGARTAALVAGCKWKPGARPKGGSVIRGNVLMAPMGLDSKALYVQEKQRPGSCASRCLAAMYTWKYYLFLVLLALLTVCTFEAKSMTLTVAVRQMLSDDMSRKIGLDGTLRPFGWEWLWQHPIWVEVADWSVLGFLVLECVVRAVCQGVAGFSSDWKNLMDIALAAVDAILATFEYVIWAELGHRGYRTGAVDSPANNTVEAQGTADEQFWRSCEDCVVWRVWNTSEEHPLGGEIHQHWAWWEHTQMKFIVVVILRNLKLVRLLPRLLALRKKVTGKWGGSKWGLHEVVARRTNRGIEISWANVLRAGWSAISNMN